MPSRYTREIRLPTNLTTLVPTDSDLYANRWPALWAAMFGYMLDAMDVLLLVFALQAIRHEFGLSNAQAGSIGSATLIASAAGGILAGFFSDRFGRMRTLLITVLIYSFASAGTATSQTVWQLLVWRALVGFGLGGEWAAGATLVSESWPPDLRGRATGFTQSGWAIGYMLAAIAAGLILPHFGWRMLFLVGVTPALLTVYIRRSVKEPPLWLHQERIPLRAALTRSVAACTVLATTVAGVVLLAYWGVFTWLPSFLGAPASQGGAGLDIIHTSRFVFLSQAGAWLGYNVFGFLSDRIGRRVSFFFYVTTAAILVPIYGTIPRWGGSHGELWLQLLAPAIGFFGTGFFSLFGSMLAELYPTAIRGVGQALTYNVGRAIAALAPYGIGRVADGYGFGAALACTSFFFLLGGILIFTLPETRGTRFGKVAIG
jgi:MFS family permease